MHNTYYDFPCHYFSLFASTPTDTAEIFSTYTWANYDLNIQKCIYYFYLNKHTRCFCQMNATPIVYIMEKCAFDEPHRNHRLDSLDHGNLVYIFYYHGKEMSRTNINRSSVPCLNPVPTYLPTFYILFHLSWIHVSIWTQQRGQINYL